MAHKTRVSARGSNGGSQARRRRRKPAPSQIHLQPFWGNPRLTSLIACTTDTWAREIAAARQMDQRANEACSRSGRDEFDKAEILNFTKAQHAYDGYVLAIICTNSHGFCVRDGYRDGLGYLLRAGASRRGSEGSAARAIDFARRWHARAPDRREVVVGYLPPDRRAEWDSAVSTAIAAHSCTSVEATGPAGDAPPAQTG